MALTTKQCVPCTRGMPAIEAEEAQRRLAEIPGWSILDGPKLEQRFKFKDFLSALDFINKVGAVAEEQNHHPDLALGWGYATVTFFTHAIKGLSDNDFIMAAKVNALYR